jgi:hypothetical protein
MPDRDDRPRRIWHEGIDMAYELIQRHPELLADCPPPSDILFVLDTVNEPQSKGKPVMAKVSKITTKVVDFLDAGEKTWMLEWFSQNNGYLTLNQQYILLCQQLLLFEAVGDSGDHRIGGWDIQESEIIADRLGLKWASDKRGEAPDIMADDFQWGRVGQSRIRFIHAREEERQRRREGDPPKPKAVQSELDFSGKSTGVTLQPTETAILQGGGDGPPRLTIIGPEGAREIQPRVTGPKPDGWQPDQPLVNKEQAENFRPSTPNISGAGSD